MSFQDMTLNNLNVRFQWFWSFGGYVLYSCYTNTKRVDSNTQIHRWKQIHTRLRCSDTNILWLTSEFGSSTREERDTILKSFISYYVNNIFQWPKSNSMPQWQELNYSLPWSTHKILTPWLELNFSTSWSDPNLNSLPTSSTVNSQLPGRTPTLTVPLRQTTQVSAYITQSQLLTASFWKSSNSQEHRLQAWRHSHSRTFPIWGLLWQFWYPLRADVNYTQCYTPKLRAE